MSPAVLSQQQCFILCPDLCSLLCQQWWITLLFSYIISYLTSCIHNTHMCWFSVTSVSHYSVEQFSEVLSWSSAAWRPVSGSFWWLHFFCSNIYNTICFHLWWFSYLWFFLYLKCALLLRTRTYGIKVFHKCDVSDVSWFRAFKLKNS